MKASIFYFCISIFNNEESDKFSSEASHLLVICVHGKSDNIPDLLQLSSDC